MASGRVIAHWHTLVDDLSASSLVWYEACESNVRERELPGVTMARTERSESGIGSGKRTYLRITRGRFSFDICAAPFGRDFFFSWWLVEERSTQVLVYGLLAFAGLLFGFGGLVSLLGGWMGTLIFLIILGVAWTAAQGAIEKGAPLIEEVILAIPLWGALYSRFWRPPTYFTTDTRLMFQEAVHRCVIEAIDGTLTAKGLRSLASDATRPTMRDILA